MNQWPMVKLGDVARKTSQVNPKKFPDEDFCLYSIPAYDAGCAEYLTGKEIGSSKPQLQAGDVLLSKIVPHIRRSWVVESHDIRTLGSSEWIVFNDSRFDPNFLREYLLSDQFHHQFMTTVAGVGGSLNRARPAAVFNLSVPLPPLEKQAEIAEVLRNSAQQITLQQNSIKQTSSICSNYYSLIQKDNYPELSLMNAGITKTSGKSITAKGNDPHETNRVLKVNAVSSGSFKPEESKPLPKSYSPHPSHSVCYGDLLFARASGTAALLGACTIVDKTVDNIFLPDKIWNLHTNGSPISKFYLLEALRSNNFRKIAESQFSSSTGVKNIKTSVLMNFAVKVPPPDTLNKFNQVFKYTASIIQKQKEKLALLEELHQSLATRAFAGQL